MYLHNCRYFILTTTRTYDPTKAQGRDSMIYSPTALEDWITHQYTRNHIKTALDIDIAEIARIYSIFIHYRPMPARYDIYDRYKAIILDSRSNIHSNNVNISFMSSVTS